MAETVKLSSGLPEDATTGRWSGGRGTIIDAWYEYRKFDTKKGPTTVVEGHLIIEDANGEKHGALGGFPRYHAGWASDACIRETHSEDADEAEKGWGLSGREGKQHKYRTDDEIMYLFT